MSDELDDALDSVYDKDRIGKYRSGVDASYEDKIVVKFLTSIGKAGTAYELRALVKERTGNNKLSFALLRAEYANFPMWVVAKKLGHVYQTTIPELFDKFDKSKIAKAWYEAFEDNEDYQGTALVFEFPGVKGTTLVCHDLDEPCCRAEATDTAVVAYSGGYRVWLEKAEPFYKRLYGMWGV